MYGHSYQWIHVHGRDVYASVYTTFRTLTNTR